jgi:hypothetical protein
MPCPDGIERSSLGAWQAYAEQSPEGPAREAVLDACPDPWRAAVLEHLDTVAALQWVGLVLGPRDAPHGLEARREVLRRVPADLQEQVTAGVAAVFRARQTAAAARRGEVAP